MALPDLNRLKSQLATSKVRETDSALFQMLNTLIDFIARTNGVILTETGITGSGTGGSVTTLLSRTYLTEDDETSVLVNSRQLLAGDNITFDDLVVGELTIDGANWSVLTDGDLTQPELIFANGEVIMVHV